MRKYQTEEERKAANRERQRRWRERHPEKNREKIRRWMEDNPEKVKESNKRWREANPDYQKQWREENAEEIKELKKEYRNTPMGRAGYLVSNYQRNDKEHNRGECTLTAKWVVDNIFTSKCHWCKKETDWTKLGCDRINNDLPHTEDNVVPCCDECNKKRGTKTYEEFYDSRRIQQTEAIQ